MTLLTKENIQLWVRVYDWILEELGEMQMYEGIQSSSKPFRGKSFQIGVKITRLSEKKGSGSGEA